jgi:hypothetical protein
VLKNEEGRIKDSALLVDVIGHLYNTMKELQGTDKLITQMHYNINAFKFKFGLWNNQ